jgi:hypothetical protein
MSYSPTPEKLLALGFVRDPDQTQSEWRTFQNPRTYRIGVYRYPDKDNTNRCEVVIAVSDGYPVTSFLRFYSLVSEVFFEELLQSLGFQLPKQM